MYILLFLNIMIRREISAELEISRINETPTLPHPKKDAVTRYLPTYLPFAFYGDVVINWELLVPVSSFAWKDLISIFPIYL